MGDILVAQQHTGLIPVEISENWIKRALNESAILKLCNAFTMNAPKVTVPTLIDVPTMAFVSELEEIPVRKPKIIDIQLEAKKMSILIPMSAEMQNLTVVDLMTTFSDVIVNSFRSSLDAAIIKGAKEIGSNEDKVFPTILEKAALQKVVKGTNGSEGVNYLDDLSDAMSTVTKQGFPVTGILANLDFENHIRKLKDKNNQFLFEDTNKIFGKEVTYTNKLEENQLIVADFSKILVGIFKDLTYNFYDSGTVKVSETEEINLIQNDAAVLKITAYVGSTIAVPSAIAGVLPE